MSFIKSQIKDQIKGNIFFPLVRKSRRQEIEKKKTEYKWGAPDFKLYPSSLTFTMCPIKHLRALEKFSGIEDIDAIYRVKRGSAVHEELQRDLVAHDTKALYPLNVQVSLEMAKKLLDGFPEVAFYDPDSGISGRLDGLLSLAGEPIPLEIKTTSVSQDRWPDYTEKMLPSSQHLCQGSIYCYQMNKLGYVKTPVKRFVLAYLNLLYQPGDLKAEKEYIINYDGELEDKTTLLIRHLAIARKAYMAGDKDFECEYPLCFSCKKERKKNEDTGVNSSA